MKISVHVSSDKSLRLRDSTDSVVGIAAQDYKEREVIWPCHATLYSKKKEKVTKENSVLISSAIYFILILLYFYFYFLFFIL